MWSRTKDEEQGAEVGEQRSGSRSQGAGSRSQGTGGREQRSGSRSQGAGVKERESGSRVQGTVAGSREQGQRAEVRERRYRGGLFGGTANIYISQEYSRHMRMGEQEEECKGFIVTSHYTVEKDGAIVHLYGRLENGESFEARIPARPYFFVKTKDAKKVKDLLGITPQETGLSSMDGENVSKVE
ncbi:MAG: hypothetical protein ACOCZV_01830, partial [Nanoarchaeota archaeon]